MRERKKNREYIVINLFKNFANPKNRKKLLFLLSHIYNNILSLTISFASYLFHSSLKQIYQFATNYSDKQ